MIRRRDFLCGLIGAAGLAALPWKSASTLPGPLVGERKQLTYGAFRYQQTKIERALAAADESDVCALDHNWWAHRESMRQLAQAGYEIKSCGLSAVNDQGFRHVTVRMADGTEIEYLAAWTLVTHQQENKHWGSIALPCDDCGTRPMGQHDWRCKHSTALAHHLCGDWSAYRVIS